MNKKEVLDKFGQLLISSVRDQVLDFNNQVMIGKMGGKRNQLLHEKIKNISEEEKELIKMFYTRAVDSTLHYFLWMLEQYEEYDLIKYVDEKKKEFVSIRDISDGLCGELHTEEGWVEKYSKYPPSIE